VAWLPVMNLQPIEKHQRRSESIEDGLKKRIFTSHIDASTEHHVHREYACRSKEYNRDSDGAIQNIQAKLNTKPFGNNWSQKSGSTVSLLDQRHT
jgi:hypothetical protein